jgi:hypothetical protein
MNLLPRPVMVNCDTISVSAVTAAISSNRHRRDGLHG